jgi:hypothetical protein
MRLTRHPHSQFALFFLLLLFEYYWKTNLPSERAFLYRWIFAGIPVLICFLGCIGIMILICHAAVSVSRNSSRHRNRWRKGQNNVDDDATPPSSINLTAELTSLGSKTMHFSLPVINETAAQSPPQPPKAWITRTFSPRLTPGITTSRNMSNRDKEVIQQAKFFIAAFLGTFALTYTNRIVEQITGSYPFWLGLVARTVLSMQGFLNILIYTRPHVITKRRRHTNYSWFKAFIEVVKAGGDNDGNTRRRRRRGGGGIRRRLSWISKQKPAVAHDQQPPSKNLRIKGRYNLDLESEIEEPENINIASDAREIEHSSSSKNLNVSSDVFDELKPEMEFPRPFVSSQGEVDESTSMTSSIRLHDENVDMPSSCERCTSSSKNISSLYAHDEDVETGSNN